VCDKSIDLIDAKDKIAKFLSPICIQTLDK